MLNGWNEFINDVIPGGRLQLRLGGMLFVKSLYELTTRTDCAVMDDVRGRIIDDCVRLQSFAEDLAKALADGDERRLLRLYEGRSQDRVLKQITSLIDDLGMCRTIDDLPGAVRKWSGCVPPVSLSPNSVALVVSLTLILIFSLS